MEIWKKSDFHEDAILPGSMFTEDGLLKCPHCGEYYTHLEYLIPYSEKDSRPCIELVFSCEHCRGEEEFFSVCIHQHEGFTYLTDAPEK